MSDTRKPDQSIVFDSLEDFASCAQRHSGEFEAAHGWDPYFCGAESIEAALSLARNGWQEAEVEALNIVDSAIDAIDAETDVVAFRPLFAMSGAEVDMGRYLSGEPECMVDYELITAPSAGRVITLCASVCVSAAVSNETIKKRGYGIAALAFALMRLGFAVELWADITISGSGFGGKALGQMRILVKGLNDELDPSKVMFGYAHPAMLRGLGLPVGHEFEPKLAQRLGIGRGYGRPAPCIEDLPEGTIYLPEICSNRDVPDAYNMLMRYMRELGIVPAAE